jgi:hypothetical protein
LLLLASFCVALSTSLPPEKLIDPGSAALLLRAQAGPALEITYGATWLPGRHQVFWRPPLRQLRPEEAVLRLDMADSRVEETAFAAGRMAWTVDVPRQGRLKLVVLVPINDLDWRLEATCRVDKSRLLLQPYLSMASNGADPFRADRVSVLSPQGDPVVLRLEPTSFTPGYRVRLPAGPPLPIPGRLVHRFYADRGEVRRLFVSRDPASLEQMIRFDLKALTFLRDNSFPVAAALSVSPDRGLQIDLGRSASVWVRRVIMDEHREHPDLDAYGRVQGFDTIEDYQLEALSAADAPLDLEIIEPLAATWDIKTAAQADTSRPNEATLKLALLPLKPSTLVYSIIKHSGTRASR